MELPMFYMETYSRDPAYNLAFEEYVLIRRTAGSYLLLWQNENTVVIGQNQNAEEEINRGFIESHKIHVVRRTTGGGAVYHDLGNLNYSFITDADTPEALSLRRFTGPVVEALRELGIPAEASGRNDILVEGKKVSGTAQRLFRNRVLHHGTLLFDSDLDMVSGALRTDPEKFRSKSAKSVRGRVGNIRSSLKKDMELSEFWEYLRQKLTGSGACWSALTPEEEACVAARKQEKYDTWAWNFGKSPAYTMRNKRYCAGGKLDMCLDVREGRIEGAAFYGDFLALRPLDQVTQALRGCRYRRDEVSAVLDRFAIGEYFGGISREEVLDTIFLVEDIEQ